MAAGNIALPQARRLLANGVPEGGIAQMNAWTQIEADGERPAADLVGLAPVDPPTGLPISSCGCQGEGVAVRFFRRQLA